MTRTEISEEVNAGAMILYAAHVGVGPTLTRTFGCGKCAVCKEPNCGNCKFCKDKAGDRKLHRACAARRGCKDTRWTYSYDIETPTSHVKAQVAVWSFNEGATVTMKADPPKVTWKRPVAEAGDSQPLAVNPSKKLRPRPEAADFETPKKHQ